MEMARLIAIVVNVEPAQRKSGTRIGERKRKMVKLTTTPFPKSAKSSDINLSVPAKPRRNTSRLQEKSQTVGQESARAPL